MQPRKALGKGLASLIPDMVRSAMATPLVVMPAVDTTQVATLHGGNHHISIDSIVPNRLQPRKHFDDDALEDLCNSIRVHGVIQPIVVCPLPNGRYEIIAGERRWRASRKAGLTEVPVVFKDADDEAMLELAIIENIQRQDLNPVEEATAYQELIKQFGYSQEQVAEKMGKSRSAIANSLRLLNLPKVLQEDIAHNRLSAGHARALLTVEDLQAQLAIREQILRSQLTVRDVERLVQNRVSNAVKPERPVLARDSGLSPQWKQVQEDLTMALGTKVMIQPGSDMKSGKVVIEYYSAQDLSRIHDIIVDKT